MPDISDNKPTLVLTGEDGNAFGIIARARRAARQAKWGHEQIEAMCKEAMAGDYDHVLNTMFKYFDVE